MGSNGLLHKDDWPTAEASAAHVSKQLLCYSPDLRGHSPPRQGRGHDPGVKRVTREATGAIECPSAVFFEKVKITNTLTNAD